MTDRARVNTSLLVYAYDRSQPEKQRRALELLDRLAVSRTGVLSTQVLADFFVAVTRKIPAPRTCPPVQLLGRANLGHGTAQPDPDRPQH